MKEPYGMLLGFLLGTIASVIAAWVWETISHWKLKRMYSPLSGDFLGYNFARENGTVSWVLEKTPRSRASIKYLRNNILEIRLTHNNLVWIGEMTLEIERFGSVVWNYVNLQDGQHRFGFKRCIIKDSERETIIYLAGDKSEGYGDEVLVRKKA